MFREEDLYDLYRYQLVPGPAGRSFCPFPLPFPSFSLVPATRLPRKGDGNELNAARREGTPPKRPAAAPKTDSPTSAAQVPRESIPQHTLSFPFLSYPFLTGYSSPREHFSKQVLKA